MAALPGVNAGVAAVTDPNLAGAVSYPYFGVSATITITNVSVTINLPTDANGNLYSAYLITANGLAWFNLNTDGTAAAAGTANNYLINGSGIPVIAPIKKNPGAPTKISAIMDSGAAGKVCVTGIL